MSKVKYGELSDWDDADIGENHFMNLKEGQNKLRVLTNPYQFVVHWVEDVSGSKKKIKCAIKDCPLCGSGVKAQTRWYVGVLDRSSKKPKVLEISSQIFNGIRTLLKDPDWNKKIKKSWGRIMSRDVSIFRAKPGTNPLYGIMPTSVETDLTPEETTMVEDFLSAVDINVFTQPSTVEQVLEKMGKKKAEVSKPADETPEVKDDDWNFDSNAEGEED